METVNLKKFTYILSKCELETTKYKTDLWIITDIWQIYAGSAQGIGELDTGLEQQISR